MSQDAEQLLAMLGKSSLRLAAAVLVVTILLRWTRLAEPRLHRAAWLLALLAGWIVLRVPIVLPWWPATAQAIHGAVQRVAFAAPTDSSPAQVRSTVGDRLADRAAPSAQTASAQATTVQVTSVDAATARAAANNPTPDDLTAAKPQGTLPGFRVPRWPLVLAALWACGVVGIAVAWLASYRRFVSRLPAELPSVAEWTQQWNAVLAEQGVSVAIPLRVTDQLGPLLSRLPGGYVLLIPEQPWCALSPAQRRAILVHELEHYRRGDVWTALLARILALPHWFNPLAWLAVGRLEEAAEWACDQAALAQAPATDYARALLALGSPTAGGAVGYGAAARGGVLRGRIRRILAPAAQDSSVKLAGLSALACLLLAASVIQVEGSQPGNSPQAAVSPAAPLQESSTSSEEAVARFPSKLSTLSPLDRVEIEVQGTLPDGPIRGFWVVDPAGEVALGPQYGRVKIAGLDYLEAEEAVRRHLRSVLSAPEVMLTRAGRASESEVWSEPMPRADSSLEPIRAGMVLRVLVSGALAGQPVRERTVVEEGGTISLGPAYGRVTVGRTTRETEERVRRRLNEILEAPKVVVDYWHPAPPVPAQAGSHE